jgi:RHS repeat-associated protein
VPNRHGSSDSYRYGFNGKENDNEVMGEGNFQDYGMRMYNPRIGRFFSVDPLTKSYPWLTPYQFANNKPIWATDLDGLEAFIATETVGTGHAFLVVKTSKELIVYTYGRYGAVDWNQTSGEGVLIKLTGHDAVDYINTEMTRMDAKFFEVGDVAASKIKTVVDTKYNSGKLIDLGEGVQGSIIDEYNLFGSNCSTHSSDWLIDGGTKVFKESSLGIDYNEDFVVPSSLENYLIDEDKDITKSLVPADNKMKKIVATEVAKQKLEGAGKTAEASGSSGKSSGSSANSSSGSSTGRWTGSSSSSGSSSGAALGSSSSGPVGSSSGSSSSGGSSNSSGSSSSRRR